MQSIKVKEGQTSIDIAMQYGGDAANALAIALQNDRSITDDLAIGAELFCGDAAIDKIKYVQTFSKYNAVPASAITTVETLEGIGHWIIGQDFVVQ